ncbi:MAG: hypothetical protein ACD_61C00101G0001 [uncultured bacterium]|nr:MAG: hypothetical protein ACD_61C00101G0001 [uncultured bacterium]
MSSASHSIQQFVFLQPVGNSQHIDWVSAFIKSHHGLKYLAIVVVIEHLRLQNHRNIHYGILIN